MQEPKYKTTCPRLYIHIYFLDKYVYILKVKCLEYPLANRERKKSKNKNNIEISNIIREFCIYVLHGYIK